MDALVIDNVSKSFGTTRAVENLSLRVPAGSILGLLGPNGAGKTTTIRMVMDIIAPDSGRIEVLGGHRPAQVKDRVGYLPEERGLYRKMKVLGTLRYFASLKGIAGEQTSRCAWQWIEWADLRQYAHRRVEELSRGMQQKLQFAIACIHKPELVILDEPFAGLDPINLDLMKAVISALRGQGAAILLSTHMMHHAEQMCDAIVLIHKGKAVLEGKLEDLQGRWRTNCVVAEMEGDREFLGALPFVSAVRPDGQSVEISLTEGADPQALLEAMVSRVRIRSFRLKSPTLHEMFIRIVGGKDAQNP
jgi:ABC-2 type transport system ATP-binding protein